MPKETSLPSQKIGIILHLTGMLPECPAQKGGEASLPQRIDILSCGIEGDSVTDIAGRTIFYASDLTG